MTVTLNRPMQSGNLPGININKPKNTIEISKQKENNLLPQTGESANYLLLLLGLIILIFVTYFYNKTNKWRKCDMYLIPIICITLGIIVFLSSIFLFLLDYKFVFLNNINKSYLMLNIFSLILSSSLLILGIVYLLNLRSQL